MLCWKLKQHQHQTFFKITYRQLQWIRSPLSFSKLLPDFLKETFVPRSAKHGLQNIILANSPIFVRGLPGGSAKTRPAGLRRCRPPRTPCEHSWQKVLRSFYDGRRRGRPPRSAVETLLLSWSHRPKGHTRGRPPNNYPRSCSRPNLSFCILGIGHYFLSNSCYPHIKEGAQRLRPGESTKAQHSSTQWDNARRRSLRLVTDILQRDVLIGAVFSATLFRNFSSHVNVRRDVFVFSFT